MLVILSVTTITGIDGAVILVDTDVRAVVITDVDIDVVAIIAIRSAAKAAPTNSQTKSGVF